MKTIRAEIITIGDEILYGQTIDTNSHWISQKLNENGIQLIQKTTVSDKHEAIHGALEEAFHKVDIILITGGLGPTKDDITKKSLAVYFNTSLRLNEEALVDIEAKFAARGRPMNALNRRQAELPENCELIRNRLGTAPAMWFKESGKIVVSMPGVPFEMETIMTEEIIPRFKRELELPVIYHKIIKTIGIPESWIAEKLSTWENNLPENIRLAYLPGKGEVKLRLTASGAKYEKLKQSVEAQVKTLIPFIEDYIYAYDDLPLEEAMGTLLKNQGKTLAVAESCTGGLIAHSITAIPGSSDYFQGGIIPYHNDHKINLLGVKPETLEAYGAVSQQTVEEMANNVRNRFNTDIGLATSGIAGPGGGTVDKPVGTIWIAYADGQQTIAQKLQLNKSREINIKFTQVAVLNLMRKQLNHIHMEE